jgi:hypothetical protein
MKHTWLTGMDHEENRGQISNTLYPDTLKEKDHLGKTSVGKRKALEQIRIK